jgi:pimeloyl-ACP methyl ester carboxylesterase
MEQTFRPEALIARQAGDAAIVSRQAERMLLTFGRRAERLARTHGERARSIIARSEDVAQQLAQMSGPALQENASAYAVDAMQRGLLLLDTLRARGNNDFAHEAAGTPPVLNYRSEVVIDGGSLPRPVNYLLLKILPPPDVAIDETKQPYMIIDPRAGHGAGIGGFKPDSQVGVALRAGHPVYFVAFRPHPVPGQTIADVTAAEAEFVKEIARRHPGSHKPIVVGNCQGGWAAMLLAATHPDLTGALVINGAPLAYWSGRVGENPMRYYGGLFGGVLPALILADLGHGEFDGANLVANFEQLDPARNYFRKYYDLFADVAGQREKFLEFERWWGGFHFVNEAEIRWVVEQLFIGNRLSRGEALIAHGHQLDLRLIRAPIILFASWGDNITPPQQALNWIADTYADEREIRTRGQRVIYMVHEKVGHLGIFVSSSVAKKEHSELATTMETIEAMAPGLYEMKIEEEHGQGYDARFLVSFHERTMQDLLAIDEGGREEESDFAAVARLSELGAETYDLMLRPIVRACVSAQSAQLMQWLHPMRLQRAFFSDRNPLMTSVAVGAQIAAAERKTAPPDNPFLLAERLWADAVEQAFDLFRDFREAWFEMAFQAIYGTPFMHWIGRTHDYRRVFPPRSELRNVPEVQSILLNIERGGFAEAVIRMLIILAETRGSVRRDRLRRSFEVLSRDEPFASLGPKRRVALIHEQAVIVEFEPERAVESLPVLLPQQDQREKAIAVVEYIAGSLEEMAPHTIRALQQFRRVLGLSVRDLHVPKTDPLKAAAEGVDNAAA